MALQPAKSYTPVTISRQPEQKNLPGKNESRRKQPWIQCTGRE